VVFNCDILQSLISIWIRILYFQMWTRLYQWAHEYTVLYCLQATRCNFFTTR